MARCDILIPGHYFCDLIFTGIPDFPALGQELYTKHLNIVPGGCLNTITALRRLQTDVGWLGVLGTDMFSRFISDWVAREDIRQEWLLNAGEPFQRVTVALSYPDDRAFVTYVDQPPSLLTQVLHAIHTGACAHLHFTNLTLDPLLPEVLLACRAAGITVSMDCQHRPYTLKTPLLVDVLGRLDMFMPNAKEAQSLTGTGSVNEAARVLREFTPLVVIKDGANGAHVWQNDTYIYAPALALTPVDTTGAGDVFNAGFLAAWRAGHDLDMCMKWGNIAGGLSTLGYGGAAPSPTLETLQTFL